MLAIVKWPASFKRRQESTERAYCSKVIFFVVFVYVFRPFKLKEMHSISGCPHPTDFSFQVFLYNSIVYKKRQTCLEVFTAYTSKIDLSPDFS